MESIDNGSVEPTKDIFADVKNEELEVVGHLEDGTPVVSRESLVAQAGEEAVAKIEAEAEMIDAPEGGEFFPLEEEANAEPKDTPADSEGVAEDVSEEEVAIPAKKVVSHDGHYDANGRFIEEDHYEDGTGMTVAIDGVKVN